MGCTRCKWSISKDAAEADSAKVTQMLQMALHGITQLKRGDEEACRYAEGDLEKTITGHRQVFHESSRKHADAHVCAADAWCSVHPRKSVRHLSIALSLMLSTTSQKASKKWYVCMPSWRCSMKQRGNLKK